MWDFVLELLDAGTQHLLRKYFGVPLRTFLGAVFFFIAFVTRHHLPQWALELVFGQWVWVALNLFVGTVNLAMFRFPFMSEKAGVAAWLWSFGTYALVVGVVAWASWSKQRWPEVSVWYPIAVWGISQALFLRRAIRHALGDVNGLIMRGLYGILFFFTLGMCGLLGGMDPNDWRMGTFAHGFMYLLGMTWVNMRVEAEKRSS